MAAGSISPFDDLESPLSKGRQIDRNYRSLFHRIPHRKGPVPSPDYYKEPDFSYREIPYRENLEISGYFMSEKYFRKYKNLIVIFFRAPPEIEADLEKDYSGLLTSSEVVGIHVRTWYADYQSCGYDSAFYKAFLPPDMEYYKKAISLFEPGTVFAVVSDKIDWCKRNFAGIPGNFFSSKGKIIYTISICFPSARIT